MKTGVLKARRKDKKLSEVSVETGGYVCLDYKGRVAEKYSFREMNNVSPPRIVNVISAQMWLNEIIQQNQTWNTQEPIST